jgi:hypothetical protein
MKIEEFRRPTATLSQSPFSLMRPLLLLATAFLTSCGGYQLGGVKPKSLAHVKKIAVPMFDNDTQHPRAEAIATSAVVSAFVEDGTYQVVSRDQADAVLEGKVKQITYSQLRSNRLDTMLPEELENDVTLDWELKDAKNPLKTLARGYSKGNSRFFLDANLQTARNSALPDAMERASEALVSRLSNGY